MSMQVGRPAVPPTEDSILDILHERASVLPDRQIFSFLQDGEFETETLTYHQLRRRVLAIAARLQTCTQPGDRVILLYPPGLEFICALYGCFAAGVIATPAYPPRLELASEGVRPLRGIAKNCEPAAVLIGGEPSKSIYTACHQFEELASAKWIVTDDIPSDEADAYRNVPLKREMLALLQYTSGSTGDPKGVMLSHGNILENQYVIQLSCGHRTAEEPGVGVCWLPFYHDLGLIGHVLQAVYVDGPCWFMSPLILLQRPVRWLEAISKYRAHTTGGPNFAYDLCARRVTEEQKASLDLSCWKVAAIGAEPISPETLDRFTEAFAPCGFRREAFFPGYGLAEATLHVSTGTKHSVPVIRTFPTSRLVYDPDGAELETEDDTSTQTLVGCGHAWPPHEMLIVDPVRQVRAADGAVGEIWFRGPSVAQGYWNREQETQETFHAYLADSGDGPFLRTGDLGFLDDGELFVCGRLKDLIVIRGRNIYPQDIEQTVCAVHEAFRPNTGVAVGAMIDGEERLVVLQEIDRQSRALDPDVLARQVVRAVSEQHNLQVSKVVFLRNGSLPKTTSGKVRRHESKQRYLRQQLILWKGKARE